MKSTCLLLVLCSFLASSLTPTLRAEAPSAAAAPAPPGDARFEAKLTLILKNGSTLKIEYDRRNSKLQQLLADWMTGHARPTPMSYTFHPLANPSATGTLEVDLAEIVLVYDVGA